MISQSLIDECPLEINGHSAMFNNINSDPIFRMYPDIKEVFKESFGLLAQSIEKLNGYHNINYLVKTDQGNYILKTYPYTKELFDILNAENEALIHLNNMNLNGIPNAIKNKENNWLITSNNQYIYRLLTFVDGEFLGDIHPSETLLKSFGKFLAHLNLSLKKFDSYVLRSRQWPWDLQYLESNKSFIPDIPDAHNRSIVEYFFLQFEEHVRPVLPHLRKQVIHNDANEWNVLCKSGEVCGIIDFGDIAYSILLMKWQ